MPDKFSPTAGPFGIYAPTITAYTDDSSISLKGTRQFVRFLLDQGVDGLTPLGSAGEPCALTVEERKQLLEAIMEEVGRRRSGVCGDRRVQHSNGD